MSNTVYRKIELTGTSDVDIESAIRSAVERASDSVSGLQWFEVTELRGRIEQGQISSWQVSLKAGVLLDIAHTTV